MTNHISPHPGFTAKIVAPLARTWQGVQDGVARVLWFKNAGNFSAVVGIAGLTTMAVSTILGPLAPAVHSAGLFIASTGGVGLVENHVTKRLARMDQTNHS